MVYSETNAFKRSKNDFIKWVKQEYWFMGGADYKLEQNEYGDFKNPWVDFGFQAYRFGRSCNKKDEIIKSLSSELQKIIDAADGNGWMDLDPSFKTAREALKGIK